MKLRVFWVGKTQEEWIRRGIGEYAGRILRYLPFETVEVKEEKGVPTEIARSRECERITRLISGNARLILLDERGEEMSSPEFSSFMGRYRDAGTAELAFVIGGAYGFTEGFCASAHRAVALSRMTFTHQMVRVFLLEQIYRGLTILNGEQYHH